METGVTRLSKDQEAKLIARAWKDDSFKERLLRNAKEVYEEEIGITLPENIVIKAFAETPDAHYLIIPVKPESCGELSDEELFSAAILASSTDSQEPEPDDRCNATGVCGYMW